MKKKIISAILALTMSLTMIPIAIGATEATTLQNLYKKLQDGKANIAYLGGSVTVGNGASNEEVLSWRGLVGQWFKDNFPSATITNVNAGRGATGTYFGSYRAYQDMQFDTNPPDLVFFEFGINDGYDGRNESQVKLDTESIIRQIYAGNPYADIIMLFTTDFSLRDTDYDCLKWQREIAEHYDIPCLYIGKALWNTIVQENGGVPESTSNSVWKKYVVDNCHPRDLGYAIYANVIEEYLYKELLDPSVSRSETVYTKKVLPSTTINDASLLKEHGRYITFTDAGFTNDDLNGCYLSGSSLIGTFENSSFAFTFTGTSVGFDNFGMPTSATLKYTITRVRDNVVVVPESEISLIKNYSSGLPFPAELATGLPFDEYRCDIIATKKVRGSDVNLKSIYINGDPNSVAPAPAPQSDVVYVPKYVSAVDNVECGSGESGTIDGVNALTVVTPDTSAVNGQVAIDNWSLKEQNISPSIYKYVGLRYYFYNPDNTSTVTKVGIEISQLNNSPAVWLGKNFTRSIVSNQWTTVYFDISEYCNQLTTQYPERIFSQVKVKPFGLDFSSTLTHGEQFYYGGMTFYAVNPMEGAFNDGNGNYYAYVSEKGTVTVGGKTEKAFTRLEDALVALASYDNATAYIDGEITMIDGYVDFPGRSSVTIRGLGDTPEDIARNKLSVAQSQSYYSHQFAVKDRNITFDYLTITGPKNECYTFAENCTLHFGEHIVMDFINERYVYVGYNDVTNGGNIVIDGGTYNAVIGGGGYGGFAVVTGDVTYELNGGNFYYIYGGSLNNKSGTNANINQLNGNVSFTLNGGNYKYPIYLGSSKGDGVSGNILFTVNGGNYASGVSIIGGHQYIGNPSGDNIANTAVVFNSKSFDGTASELVLGKSGNGSSIIGKEIYIINNSEINTGVTINAHSAAEHKILVQNGHAEPVFSEGVGGELLGFEITSDTAGFSPIVNGQILTRNIYGYYNLDEDGSGNTTVITFAETGAINITLSDGAGAIRNIDVQKNSEYYLPVCPFKREGKIFTGWSDGTNTYAVGERYDIGTKPVVFTAQFIDTTQYEAVYVSYANGDDSNLGLSAEAPVATFKKAFEIVKQIGKNDGGRIYVMGACSVDSWGDLVFAETENNVTICGYSADSEISWSNYVTIEMNGPVTFENIKLKINANGGYINTNNWPLVMGDGVTSEQIGIHAGQPNADADRDTEVTINSGSFFVRLGSFYNTDTIKNTKNVRLTINGGENEVWIGADGWKWAASYGAAKHTKTKIQSATITVNGGSASINKFNNGFQAITGAFTLIKNGGIVIDNTGAICSAKYVMESEAQTGSLAATGVPGTFFINSEMVAALTTKDGVLYKASGSLTVPSAGYYLITYTNFFDINDYFVPKDGEALMGIDTSVNGTTTVYSAKIISIADTLSMLTAEKKTANKAGLRFIAEKKSTLESTLTAAGATGDIAYGIVLVPSAIIGDTRSKNDYIPGGDNFTSNIIGAEQLYFGSTHGENNEIHSKAVFAENIYQSNADGEYFTAVITGISSANEARYYTAKAFVRYTDKNGVVRYAYSEPIRSSLYEAGEMSVSDVASGDNMVADNSTGCLGDVNNDGIIDICDLIRLKKYLANSANVEIDTTNANVDTFSVKIDAADLAALRHLLVNV